MGNAHEIVAARHGEQGGQILNIVLVGLHMVGVAAVAAHGNTRQLAHKMILQPCTGDLPGIIQIFRPDKAHHGVDQERGKALGKAVAPGLHGHLVGVKMGIGGKLRALAGLKIHHIGPLGRAFLAQQRLGLRQGRRIEAEGGVTRLAARNRLENQITGRAVPDSLHLGGHMGQHADLGRDLPMLFNLLKTPQHLAHLLRAVRHRIQPNDCIPRAKA